MHDCELCGCACYCGGDIDDCDVGDICREGCGCDEGVEDDDFGPNTCNITDSSGESADGEQGSDLPDFARFLSITYGGDWRNVLMVSLVAAFDASADKKEQWLAVGGFISEAGDWADFDKAWRARLAKDGLSYFHMVDFAHSVQEFAVGWKGNEPRRRQLLGDLLDLVESHVYCKIGFMVEATGIDDPFTDVREEFGSTPFAVAGFMAVAGAFNWCLDNFKKVPHLVFEEGDTDSTSLDDVLKRHGVPRPTYLPKKDDPKTGRKMFTPLHAADILAYEMTKATDLRPDSNGDLRLRHPFERFNRMRGSARFLRASGMPSLNEIAKGIRFFAK